MRATEVYADELVKLYHADSLDILPEIVTEPLAACVMDPPYASGTRAEALRSSTGAMVRGRFSAKPIDNDQMTTPGFVWMIRETCLIVRDLLREGGHVLSFIDWRQWPNLLGAVESTNLRVNGMLVWDKRSMGMGHGFRLQHELILHASKGPPIMATKDTPNVISASRDTATDHPSPKPIGLMERILRAIVKPGDLIVDPFAGSSSTLIAARNLGIRAIGVEMNAAHCETSAARLAQRSLLSGLA